jgi:hypothetical protein
MSLEQRRLSGGLVRLAKVAQTDAYKPVTLLWAEIHSFSQL